ncbi:glycosyltransferase [Paenibacillus thiaminolyticus]|uniref:glycosyltransferase n=1 Tax=Paenibacillus thiaminolyticus TaxID=49283 RepID=UPI003D286230
MGCGALVLTDNIPEQSELFENGVHYVLYDSQEDMLEKQGEPEIGITRGSTPLLAKTEQACRRT